VLEGPPVKLIHGLASTKEKANLAADRASSYTRFIDPGAQTRMATNSPFAFPPCRRQFFFEQVEEIVLVGADLHEDNVVEAGLDEGAGSNYATSMG
jgi:hypothetical protein